MTFLDNHENYKTYNNGKYYVNELPLEMQYALEGFLTRLAEGDANNLKFIINKIATIVNSGITRNWGWNYLLNDLSEAISILLKNDFHKFFDFLDILYINNVASAKEINRFLEDNDIGYKLNKDGLESIYWELRDENSVAPEIERSTNLIQTNINKCKQTKEHLKQLIININTGSVRAMKDALRDALSAMEAIMKEITNTQDIKEADKELRNQNIIPSFFIKDGISIWNLIHKEYPDVRHGNPNIKPITKEEVSYCLNKILIYIELLEKLYY